MPTIHERDALGAFTRHTHVACAGSASGPLAGLTFAAKDLYDIAGHRTGFGSPDWLGTHAPATRTAPAVQRLLDAGGQMVGKTHTDEMAWSLFGENAHYGTPANPKAPGRVPGGSSSGSASAVSGGLVDFALGSDTGGSVRFPASLCGVYGMRPTHGRIPLDGACALAPTFDTVGWFARDPALIQRVGRVLLADDHPAAAAGRVLIAQDAFDHAGDAVTAALAVAVASVEALLGTGERVAIATEGFDAWAEAFRNLQAGEAWTVHGAWVEATRPSFGPGVKERFEYARNVDPGRVVAAAGLREVVAKRAATLLSGNAVLVLPTAPGIAPLRNTPLDAMNVVRAKCIGLLALAGFARVPQISLPLGTVDGCPVGLSLIAAPGNDTLLLDVAERLAAR